MWLYVASGGHSLGLDMSPVTQTLLSGVTHFLFLLCLSPLAPAGHRGLGAYAELKVTHGSPCPGLSDSNPRMFLACSQVEACGDHSVCSFSLVTNPVSVVLHTSLAVEQLSLPSQQRRKPLGVLE